MRVNGNESANGAALDTTQFDHITPSPIPKNDFKNFIKGQVNGLWTAEWHNIVENIFRLVKDNTLPISTSFSSNREWERKFARLRIGHTNLTHNYLLSQGNRPYCHDCIQSTF